MLLAPRICFQFMDHTCLLIEQGYIRRLYSPQSDCRSDETKPHTDRPGTVRPLDCSDRKHDREVNTGKPISEYTRPPPARVPRAGRARGWRMPINCPCTYLL